MDVEATYTNYFVSRVEHPNLLAAQGSPLRWNFSSGTLVPFFRLLRSGHSRSADFCAKGFTWLDCCWNRYMGLEAFSEDAWPGLCTCYRKCGPPYLLALSNTECLSVLSLFDFLFSRTILVSLDVQLLGNDTHNHRIVLLSLGYFCPSI